MITEIEDQVTSRIEFVKTLAQIAKDSRGDHTQVMEALTAYVRENSPWDGHNPSYKAVTTDVQAILTVLGRRNTIYEKPGQRLDLSKTHLQGAILMDANLQWVTFMGANLRQILFFRVNLQGAIFQNAILQGANFRESNLNSAYFQCAIFIGTDLQGACIRNADLSEARNLDREQVDSAISDETTKFPDYVSGGHNQ